MQQQQQKPPQHKQHRKQWIFSLTIIISSILLLILILSLKPDFIYQLVSTGIAFLVMLFIGVLFILFLIFLFRDRDPHNKLLATVRYKDQEQQKYTNYAAQIVTSAPLFIGPDIGILGATIDGNLYSWWSHLWTVLPERDLAQHGVLIGSSGSGKTVTLLRIVYLAAKLYRYKVFFVDAKPSRQTAAHFLTLINQLGLNVAMFPRQAYNGWNGDGNAILNRLMAIETFSEPYYKATCKRVLNAICKPDPPRSSSDFLQKLDSLDLATLPGITARDLGGVQNRYHGFFDSIEEQLDGTWSFDSIDAGYLLLDGTSLKEEAAALGRYYVEDFGHYCTARKPAQQKVLLIIDEYSALSQSGADTANLFERIRESGGAILVAGQGYASMGQDIERMLDAANFYIVHRSAAPEPLTRRAGTIQQITESYQFGGAEAQKLFADDKGQIHMEEQPAVHANEARQLATGEAIIISHGKYLKTKIAQIPELPEAEIQTARRWIEQQPTSSPAQPQQIPPPTNKPEIL